MDMVLSVWMPEPQYFSSQSVPRPIWWHQAEWLAQATLLPMKKNDVLAHPGPKNLLENSNVFIRVVYIKDFSSYAHLVGCSQDPGTTNVNYRELQPRIAVQSACFNSVRVSKAFCEGIYSNFSLRHLNPCVVQKSVELNTVLWISLHGGHFLHYFQYR
jgi:hypothetical protein